MPAPRKNHNRPARVAELVHGELARLIREELKDPRLGLVSITEVNVTGDLRNARVWVTPLGGQGDGKLMVKLLEENKGQLRTAVGRNLGLRHAPELEFKLDKGIEERVRLASLLDQLERDRKEKLVSGEGESS